MKHAREMPKDSFNPMTFGGKDGMMQLNFANTKKSSVFINDQSFKDSNPAVLTAYEKNS
jgi:hypothetical protein